MILAAMTVAALSLRVSSLSRRLAGCAGLRGLAGWAGCVIKGSSCLSITGCTARGSQAARVFQVPPDFIIIPSLLLFLSLIRHLPLLVFVYRDFIKLGSRIIISVQDLSERVFVMPFHHCVRDLCPQRL